MDPVFLQAGEHTKLNETQLKSLLPKEMTIWINPLEVEVREEDGITYVIYRYSEGITCPWDPKKALAEKRRKQHLVLTEIPDILLDPRKCRSQKDLSYYVTE